jgi:hypothetical protein
MPISPPYFCMGNILTNFKINDALPKSHYAMIQMIFARQTKLNILRMKRATSILLKRLFSHFKLSLR